MTSLSDTFFRWRAGDPRALEVLAPMLYDEMRALSAAYLRRERPDHTLQATELAHEAYLRLLHQRDVTWENRAHFMGLVAQAMRRVLADHARRRGAVKRGGAPVRVTLAADELAATHELAADELDEALEDLARLEPRQARVVEMRFYAGLTTEETAEALGTSVATVKRDWTVARAWLHRELSGGEA